MPGANLTFINNSASHLGGAIGVRNIRGNEVTVVLTHFCFIQYNIGGENEYDPRYWMVRAGWQDTLLN